MRHKVTSVPPDAELEANMYDEDYATDGEDAEEAEAPPVPVAAANPELSSSSSSSSISD